MHANQNKTFFINICYKVQGMHRYIICYVLKKKKIITSKNFIT